VLNEIVLMATSLELVVNHNSMVVMPGHIMLVTATWVSRRHRDSGKTVVGIDLLFQVEWGTYQVHIYADPFFYLFSTSLL